MKIKTLTLIAAITTTTITVALSAENDDAVAPSNIYVNNERAEKQLNVFL